MIDFFRYHTFTYTHTHLYTHTHTITLSHHHTLIPSHSHHHTTCTGVDFSVLAAEAAELRRDMRRLQELFPRLTDSEVLPPLLSLHCEDSHHIPPMPGTMHSCSQQKVPSLGMSVCLSACQSFLSMEFYDGVLWWSLSMEFYGGP